MREKPERVVIAVDGTPSSRSALEQGLALAAGEDAEAVIVHVVSISSEQFVPDHHRPDRVPDGARTQVLVDAAATAEAVGVRCTTELLVGYPPSQIAAVAEWGHEPRLMPSVLNAAVDSRYWPLYEVVDGRYTLSYDPEPAIPVADWLRLQARFAHLLKSAASPVLDRIQAQVDADWRELLGKCAA